MTRAWQVRAARAEDLYRRLPETFDGNFTDDLATWLVPDLSNPEWDPKNPEIIEMLTEWTARGHLRWALFMFVPGHDIDVPEGQIIDF